jgi:hypothetical protein
MMDLNSVGFFHVFTELCCLAVMVQQAKRSEIFGAYFPVLVPVFYLWPTATKDFNTEDSRNKGLCFSVFHTTYVF